MTQEKCLKKSLKIEAAGRRIINMSQNGRNKQQKMLKTRPKYYAIQ